MSKCNVKRQTVYIAKRVAAVSGCQHWNRKRAAHFAPEPDRPSDRVPLLLPLATTKCFDCWATSFSLEKSCSRASERGAGPCNIIGCGRLPKKEGDDQFKEVAVEVVAFNIILTQHLWSSAVYLRKLAADHALQCFPFPTSSLYSWAWSFSSCTAPKEGLHYE